MQLTEEENPDLGSRRLLGILKRLGSKSDLIEASAIITSDGLIKAELLGGEIEPDRFGAMCASLLSLSKRAAKDTARGDLRLVLIEGTSGSMLVVQIGQRGVLALATKPKAKLGMIFIEARKTAQEIAELLL
ncbi:MAG: hypothetical protein GY784_04315 [Gammaproteobacteria bacterium]|nr:hypothetical protein [Gammaproteobacteria bacterium]